MAGTYASGVKPSQAEFAFHLSQRDGAFLALGTFGFAKFQQVFRVGESLLHGDVFVVGEHGELFLTVFDQDFGMQLEHEILRDQYASRRCSTRYTTKRLLRMATPRSGKQTDRHLWGKLC